MSYWMHFLAGPVGAVPHWSAKPCRRPAPQAKENSVESWPLDRTGSSGENVKTIQYLLDAAGSTLVIDGDFGPLTAAAAKSFQAGQGLTADGEVGPKTWTRLVVQVHLGSTGDPVRATQSQLDSRNAGLTIDGDFGPASEASVRDYQADVGIAVDGVVGPVTWSLLANTTARATNLVIGTRVAAELVAAAAQDLPTSDFAGLRAGVCYYAYDPADKTYWAGVSLDPSPASTDAQVFVQDDGSYQICTRPAGASWNAVNVGLAGIGGSPSPIQVPAVVASLWGWAPGSSRPPLVRVAQIGKHNAGRPATHGHTLDNSPTSGTTLTVRIPLSPAIPSAPRWHGLPPWRRPSPRPLSRKQMVVPR
jgi:peptidoglycan hydrolase-like protein with peptidoglycan-binding domain